MEDYLKAALEIVKAQASVRTMTEEEITSMVQKLSAGIKSIAEGGTVETEVEYAVDPKKAIREKSILCCVCGKSFKILTKKHLSTHELTVDEYREKFGYKKKLPLVCKSLQRERRKKMKEMKLWTKRGKNKE
ncbi:MAG: MucR family transcriptional regulator [Pseudodesulfovibrio sp.]